MAEAFEGADIVIPKSWAPFAAMEKRTNLYAEGDDAGIAALEKELLAQNATHQDWCSTTELMEKTANGQDTIFCLLYTSCVPQEQATAGRCT